ncbi:IclR family transcriptional regulator [Glaciibacter superstes]|uniref:IclR family transcriptional regulator n=1 Tax=Glaciibacter superstes TaxID=501023 RepID=UPI0003B2EC3F|nr:IclR family transcriptional regulator [Glaciibacter superstes]
MNSEPRETYELSSVDRALTILTILSRRPGIRLGELSTELGANQSTVLRALRVLQRHGFVRRGRSDVEYLLGTRLVELGQAALASIDIAQELRPLAARFSQMYNATAHIGMLRGGTMTVIDKVDPIDPVVRYSFLGARMPLHATAIGKAALALVGESLMTQLWDEPLRAHTPQTILDPPTLQADIDETQRRRFSVEQQEYQIGFGCVGSAFRIDGDVYAVSISGSLVDLPELIRRGEELRDGMDDFLAEHAGVAAGL